MSDIDAHYTAFHQKRLGVHCYPSEFLVRTLLGQYPALKLAHRYENAHMLDWGCGDGRNLLLLHNLKARVFGMEVTQSLCDDVTRRMAGMAVSADIRVGRNSRTPFDDHFFDYVIASNSLYYVDAEEHFSMTLRELNRVIRKGGYLIATFPHPNTFILAGAKEREDSHFEITNDLHGLRNGSLFKVFKTKEQLIQEFSPDFTDIAIGETHDNYYGYQVSCWLFVGKKR
ncbi:MAG: class I SAM-dependent methyltransferase [Burkholderiaceae bacterium]|jgi:SAM-dependent methyltransferase|nr:class I SAM-dependent methyltransferase [Burkholderiaceae bacterium]